MKFVKTFAATLIAVCVPAYAFDASMIPAIQKVTAWTNSAADLNPPWGLAEAWMGKEANNTPCFFLVENRGVNYHDRHPDIYFDYVEGDHFLWTTGGYTYTVKGDTYLRPKLEYYFDKNGQPDTNGEDSDLILDVQAKSDSLSIRAKNYGDAEVIVSLDSNGNPKSVTGIDYVKNAQKTCVLDGAPYGPKILYPGIPKSLLITGCSDTPNDYAGAHADAIRNAKVDCQNPNATQASAWDDFFSPAERECNPHNPTDCVDYHPDEWCSSAVFNCREGDL